MGIALKTDMQMLGLSTPEMFSFFLRVMAYCLQRLGDLTSDGGSPGGGASRVWERAAGRGRGTCQISRGNRDNRLWPVHQPSPIPSPSGSVRLELAFQELKTGLRESQMHAQTHAHRQPRLCSAVWGEGGRLAHVTRCEAHTCQPECKTET